MKKEQVEEFNVKLLVGTIFILLLSSLTLKTMFRVLTYWRQTVCEVRSNFSKRK